MGRRADDEIDQASAALGAAGRTLVAATPDAQDVESVAAMVDDVDTLLDEVRTIFPHNAAILAITEDLRRRLRGALWAGIDRTPQ